MNRSTKAGAETPATPCGWDRHDVPSVRSTKAGAETPATLETIHGKLCGFSALNEGRGRDPGDTARAARCESARERSTKAGAETPATRPRSSFAPPRTPLPLNEGRGRDPGDTCSVIARVRGILPLNEGRGRDPGDTCRAGDQPPSSSWYRSTKAGAETPATLPSSWGDPSHSSTAQRRPGPRPRRHTAIEHETRESFSAQRRPGPRPRRTLLGFTGRPLPPPRSTKAGGRDPGDTPGSGASDRAWSSLNEGRGRDPGDTPRGSLRSSRGDCAQRRPGPRPRRHTNAFVGNGIF